MTHKTDLRMDRKMMRFIFRTLVERFNTRFILDFEQNLDHDGLKLIITFSPEFRPNAFALASKTKISDNDPLPGWQRADEGEFFDIGERLRHGKEAKETPADFARRWTASLRKRRDQAII